MSIKTILFDLDGTLLPMDQDLFVATYFKYLATYMAPYGYDPKALQKLVWAGTGAMVMNDGTYTNEEVFWKYCAKAYGEKIVEDIPHFDAFYRTHFNDAQTVCGRNPLAAQIVHQLKEKGLRVALATNPLFPQIATQSRIQWAGLEPDDFELYTTYENSRHCKPNPAYYEDIVSELGLDPAECLMVGNDVDEDMVAQKLGMKVFLLTDCLINKHDVDISCYPNGDFNALLAYIDEVI